jgi:hypothetical protein
MPCEGTGKCRPPRRSPGSSERPEPSLATLMGPPGSPWSLSAPINHVRSIEQSAAWPKSVVDCEPGGRAGVGGPPFLQVVRTGLALRSDERLPSQCRRAGSGSTGSRTRPSQGQQHDATPRRSLPGPCVPRVCPPHHPPASSCTRCTREERLATSTGQPAATFTSLGARPRSVRKRCCSRWAVVAIRVEPGAMMAGPRSTPVSL